MNSTKKTFLTSLMSLLLCILMLTGTTFAWFTDVVTSTGNIIQAGNLDAEMYFSETLDEPNWKNADGPAVFNYDKWEPGYTSVRYIKVKNAGNLSFKFRLSLDANGVVSALGDVIDVYFVNPAASEITTLEGLTKVDNLTNVIKNHSNIPGELHPGEEVVFAIALHMQESAGNEYQNLTLCDGGFDVKLIATQMSAESDSFGDDYDNDAEWPEVKGNTASTDISATDGVLDSAATMTSEDGMISANVPAGVLTEDGVSKLTLSVSPMASSGANLQLSDNESSLSLDVHVEGVADGNTTAIEVYIKEALPVGLNMGNYEFYHVENGVTNEMTLLSDGETPAHNTYKYDPATGDITLYMASFSEVVAVAGESEWEGGVDHSWYSADATELKIANADQLWSFSQIVGGMAEGIEQDSFSGKTVTLLCDINLGDAEENNVEDKIFYPIGYWNSEGTYDKDGSTPAEDYYSAFYTFEGTFDGNGNTISNFYQNTWEMKGDHNWYDAADRHYRDGMGLFGKLYKATIKNLTVDNFSSDGEIATTGVIAAYADGATFTNIAITNCNPRVYNIGNGGIVGCVGWYAKEADLKTTFTNITVDNSNKISALWGSWDVACGGIVGQYYPTSGQSSVNYPENGGIHFENCHVAAQIDVYNDVCANYQYYAYRYAGMLIGSVRENVTGEDGHVYPNMDGISASGCTVHFGDWNDYYYCELVANSSASYTHDYQMSRLTQVDSIDVENMTVTIDGTTTAIPTSGRYNYVVVNGDHATENATCYHFVDGAVWNHSDAGKETVDGVEVLVEDKQHIYLEFNNLVTGYGWGVTSKGLEDFDGTIVLDKVYNGTPVEKFETNFTGDFLYRVGNQNTVSIGSLFAEMNSTEYPVVDSGVWVTVEARDENMNVSGKFTANTTDWTQGTIQFSGTGVVKVTIQDYNFCTPTTIYLEVVDAVNATTATNATANNVVLLNDAGFSSLEVSNGYALYGNGFTLTCSTDSYAKDFGYAFVTLTDGTLDNVQIVCPNFDYAALYKSNLTSSDNRSYTDASGTIRYYNARSGVMVSGNSQILNSRISGARAAVNVTGGNCVIENSRIELGAVASLLVGAANSVTLTDVTLVQKPTASTYDSSKTLMGFSVLIMATSGGDAAPITLEGTLVQNAWVDENDKQYVPEDAQTIIDTVMGEADYLHDIDGDGTNESLNLGIAYMPADGEYTVNTPSITDNRTDKDEVPYDSVEVKYSLMTTYVYSYKNTDGTKDSFKTESEYTPNKYSDIITVSYSDTSDGLTTGKSYGTDGWIYELNVDLDTLSGYELDFSKLAMSVNGVTVTDFKVNGSDKPTSPIAVTAGGTTYTLTATIDETEYTATLKVTGTETSKESPSLVASVYEAGVCVSTKDGGTWHGAAPVLEGIQIKYWSVAEQDYKTITLSDYTPTTAGQQNGTNSYWTYTPDNGDFTLTIKNETPVHSGNTVYAMPVVCDSKLYFVPSSSNGLVNSGNSARTIAITYYFNDNNNGDQLKFSNTWSVEEVSKGAYNYSDFCNGTSTINECVTPDTLITLADGTQVRVDSLTGNEELLVWNMETGMLDKAPIMFVDSETEAEFEIIKLCFSDGTEVKVIGEHGFWDYDLNKYVYLDRYAENYIGHSFAKQNADELEAVELVDVIIETEVTTAWSPVTEGHLCYFVNGMLSMPGGVGGLFNIFEVDPETMTYDYEQLEKDIETYGLFTYEELNAICPLSEEMFNAAGGAYLKISIGKGNLTMDELVYMINRYSVYFE